MHEAQTIPADPAVFERNITALSACSPEAAAAIRATIARPDVEITIADDGGATGTIGAGQFARRLASRRRPLEETKRLVGDFDPTDAGVVVVQGFGLGHHVRVLAEKMRRTGVVLVFEPDVGLLRAALERIDISEALAGSNTVVINRPDEAGTISAALRGGEAVVSLGVKIIEHPPSMPRLGPDAAAFAESLTTTVRAIRTNVVTTLMQTETSLRNGLMNLDHYACRPGIGELAGIARGRPAVVVSAGPSLARNIDLLARPGVRDHVVIIAAQTVLRPLLEAGIRPHFVTALDHHEISTRFYEGLTEQDVEGITLVVEPKANPGILDAFPGAIRCQYDQTLASVLDSGFPRDAVRMEAGGTVAHMAYTLARHLACDPVILVGQDLAFTDGQYYAPGAAIHTVWAAELNPFNTVEMMEWQRVVRNRSNLHTATDHLGRPVYTDEQMSAYQVQFERMFAADAERGLTTIDATEGGVAKRNTVISDLASALDRALEIAEPITLPSIAPAALGATRAVVASRLVELARDVAHVGDLSRETHTLLEEMRDNHGDQRRVNRLIARVQQNGRSAKALSPAYELVQHLNQTGQLKRFKADRVLHLSESVTPLERQRRQIDRDIINVDWLAESADQLGRLLESTRRALLGEAPKLTRDAEINGRVDPDQRIEVQSSRVGALIPVDPDRGALGNPRDLAEPIAAGRNALQLVLDRLTRAGGLDLVVLLTDSPERVRDIAGDALPPNAVIEHTPNHPLGERRHGVRAARAPSPDCWRGGLSSMTVYDEALEPARFLDAMRSHGLDAALIVGCDWALVDPGLTAAVIERHREDPERKRLTFTQAAPGLSPCLIDRTLMEELATNVDAAGGFASVGGLLGYIPRAAVLDPVAKPGCVRIDARLRDLGVRVIADSAQRLEMLKRTLSAEAPADASAAELSGAIRAHTQQLAQQGPSHLTLELCTGRRTGGAIAQISAANDRSIERAPMPVSVATGIIDELAAARPDALLTLGGLGDPLMHPDWQEIVSHAVGSGLAAVHVRTDLQCRREDALWLYEAGPEIISVDLLAETAETYARLAGAASFEHAQENLVALLQHRADSAGASMPTTWLVPRITRCDAVYGELESFFDRWLTYCQACVIDPLPRAVEGDRITPMPDPQLTLWRRRIAELVVLSHGRATARPRVLTGKGVASVTELGLAAAWKRVLRERESREDLIIETLPAKEPAVIAA